MGGKHVITVHHEVPESRGGTRHPHNLLQLQEHRHQAFHLIFSNKTFIGQLLVLEGINSTSLSKRMHDDIHTLVDLYKGEDELYAYKNGVLVPEKFLAAQERFK